MRWKRGGFTLIEILISVGIAGVALSGMLLAVISYMNIWQGVASPQNSSKFDSEIVLTRFISDEISSAMYDLSTLKACEKMTFKQLGNASRKEGGQAIPGNSKENIAFYWQSSSNLPFLKNDRGGITECFLKVEPNPKPGVLPVNDALKLYYRSLAPGDKPRGLRGETGSGEWDKDLESIVLLEKCKGINFGYTEELSSSPQVTFYGTPKFRDGNNPDLPELIQIVLE